MTESVAILGSTGSIGASTLAVIRQHADKYRVVGLAAHADHAGMARQCREFTPRWAVMARPAAAREVARALAGSATQVEGGDSAVCTLAAAADIVVCGIVGAAGLRSTLAAVRAGKKVLIANKEPLVMLGDLIMREARAHGATVIPLDSEHNAIFQCLPPAGGSAAALDSPPPPDATPFAPPPTTPPFVRKILLTGSGGPLLRLPVEEFAGVTPAQACAHPNWRMGRKISVDSATLMNKGLEIIEARALFAVALDDIEVLIHPQSVIHSLVEYIDGSVLAQLASPDMRVAIAHALAWPRRIDSGARRLSLLDCARLDFEAPDVGRFPCLGLARHAAATGGTAPTTLNAANEVAVGAFLDGVLRFDHIPRLVEDVLERAPVVADCDLSAALAADAEARRLGGELLPAPACQAVAG